MILTELAGYKTLTDTTLGQFLSKLRDEKKLDVLGGGAFGVALQLKGKNYVYKAWAEDGGYEHFIEVALKNQNSPAFPKLFGKIHEVPVPFKRPSSDYSADFIKVIKMEVLTVDYEKSQKLLNAIANWQDDLLKYKTIQDYIDSKKKKLNHEIAASRGIQAKKTVQHSRHKINLDTYQDYFRDLNKQIFRTLKEIKALDKVDVDFMEALLILSHELKKHGDDKRLYNDLHAGNLMWRGDQPVITDPFTGISTKRISYLMDPADLSKTGRVKRNSSSEKKDEPKSE